MELPADALESVHTSRWSPVPSQVRGRARQVEERGRGERDRGSSGERVSSEASVTVLSLSTSFAPVCLSVCAQRVQFCVV